MALFYYKSPAGNFGDDLNAWLWPRLLPTTLHSSPHVLFVGIGSILDHRIPSDRPVVVFGAGVRRLETVPAHRANWDVRFVRGPLSARALGLSPDNFISDAALALRLTDAPVVQTQTQRVGLMPHFLSMPRANWRRVCSDSGIQLIDPRSDAVSVLREIAGVRYLLSEAMHGAIVADALRIPWLRVRCATHATEGKDATELKWTDWTQAMGLHHQAEVLPYMPTEQVSFPRRLLNKAWAKTFESTLTRRLASLSKSDTFQLSSDSILFSALDRIAAQIERLKRDYG